MVTKIGISSLIIGFFLWVFAGISGLMEADNFWVDLTLSKLLGEEKVESIINLTSNVTLQDSMDVFFYDLPMSLLVAGLGLIMLVIGLFIKDY